MPSRGKMFFTRINKGNRVDIYLQEYSGYCASKVKYAISFDILITALSFLAVKLIIQKVII